MQFFGTYAVPVILVLAGAAMLFSRQDLLNEFMKGAREGLATNFRILPSLVMLICATRMFAASGALGMLCEMCGAFLRPLGIPEAMLPVVFMRPISGSAATAMINELFAEQGPDSFAGRCGVGAYGLFRYDHLYAQYVFRSSRNQKNAVCSFRQPFLTLVFCTLFSVWITGVFFS